MELEAEWPLWRLVRQNVATLPELETTWSLDDVLRANALLDVEDDWQALDAEKRRKERKR